MNETTTDTVAPQTRPTIWFLMVFVVGSVVGLTSGIYFTSINHTPRAIRHVRSHAPAFELQAKRVLQNLLERDDTAGSYPIPNELRELGVSAINKSEGMIIFSFATHVTDACVYVAYLPEKYFDSEKWTKDGGNNLFFECRVFDDVWCYIVNYC